MYKDKMIRVLVVDDSLVFREVLSRGISPDKDILVVAKAIDPFDAMDKILRFKPDVIICDVQMPRMNGIEFIRKLMPKHRIPVIVVSTVSNAVFDAMNAGAVDFVNKPDMRSASNVQMFISDIRSKIKIAAGANIVVENDMKTRLGQTNGNVKLGGIVAIGASTGGTQAIQTVLKGMPDIMPPIVIVQHIPVVFSEMFAKRLDTELKLHVREARHGDLIEPGNVFIAPGDSHMKVKKAGSKAMIEIFSADKVNGHRPSVDVLFESVASFFKNNAVGVILTGMGYDGAKGLLAMRRKGARTIGQDEKSSVVYGMPKVAFNIGAVEKQASIENVAREIISSIG